MEQRLLQFIDILRRSGLTIGIKDTHTALAAVAAVGYGDRSRLRAALATVLAGDRSEKLLLEDCFDRYFNVLPATELPPPNPEGRNALAELAGSETLQKLLRGDDNDLQMAVEQAGLAAGTGNIRYFTQKGLFVRKLLEALDWPLLQDAILQLQEGADNGQGDSSGGSLAVARELAGRMLATTREHVDRQYLLYGRPQSDELREQRLLTTPIRMLDHSQREQLRELVARICRRLHKKYRRRDVVTQRGLLDVRATLRRNMAYEGVPFRPQWRKKHKNRPQVFVMADISGSVSAASALLLAFISSLQDILPKARSFVFSNRLGEVTGQFDSGHWERSLTKIMRQWGYGSTDYGRAIRDFWSQAGGNLRRDSVVIMLGDARNNYGDAALPTWHRISRHCRAVYWLNPETPALWDTGDSIMQSYREDCRRVFPVANLAQLAEFCDYLLKHS